MARPSVAVRLRRATAAKVPARDSLEVGAVAEADLAFDKKRLPDLVGTSAPNTAVPPATVSLASPPGPGCPPTRSGSPRHRRVPAAQSRAGDREAVVEVAVQRHDRRTVRRRGRRSPTGNSRCSGRRRPSAAGRRSRTGSGPLLKPMWGPYVWNEEPAARRWWAAVPPEAVQGPTRASSESLSLGPGSFTRTGSTVPPDHRNPPRPLPRRYPGHPCSEDW